MRRIFIALVVAALVTPAMPSQPVQAIEPLPLKVVLLGDSYSAGNGARDASGDPDVYGPRGCNRSRSNWAEQYLDHLRSGGYSITFLNRACSGGVMDHLNNQRELDPKVGRTMVSGIWTLDDPELEAQIPLNLACGPQQDFDDHWELDGTAVTHTPDSTVVDYSCRHYVDPQIDAVGDDTDLLLLTMGGNDAGFDELVRGCFVFVLQSANKCRAEVDRIQRELLPGGALQTELTETLRDIRTAMRADAQIVLIGYPYLELHREYTVGDYVAGGDIRDLGDAADQIAQAAVDTVNAEGEGANIRLVTSVKTAFVGHEPDGSAATNPETWMWEFALENAGLIFSADLYHPNPDGHAAWATALTPFLSFGATGQGLSGDVDIVFTIDTTGSMGADIAEVKEFAAAFLGLVEDATASHRVAVVTYRDHPEHTGSASDYPARVEIGFSEDNTEVINTINAITVSGGGDAPESVYSGLIESISLPWRPGVKKMVIQLGDAGPHDPEPVTGYTADDVVAAAWAVDPAEVYAVNVSAGAVSPLIQDIATQTNGGVYSAPTPAEVAAALGSVIEDAVNKPYAWAAGPYVTPTGQPVLLDASGSYDSDGTIVTYEWDLDGNGSYDVTSAQPTREHTFTSDFDGVVALRVTDDEGNFSIATALAHASLDGDQVPADLDNCPTLPNHGQEDFDGDGVGDPCDETLWGEAPQQAIVTERVSESSSHGQGNGVSDDAYMSADARYVTFRSTASTLVTGDSNGVMDAFVRDRLTDTTTRVSTSGGGVQGNGASDDPAFSADGRFVTFRSQASNFVANDPNGSAWDIFVKDTTTGAIERVSLSSAGAQANNRSADPGLSADGQVVAFSSLASNLVAGDTNGAEDIFVRDRSIGTTTRLSVASGGTQANGASEAPLLSDDGRYVVFQSTATNLVAGDTNGARDIFVHDRTTGTTSRVSVSSSGAQADAGSNDPVISGDGSTVAFESDASNLVSGDTNGRLDVFVRAMASGLTTRASVTDAGAQGTGRSSDPSLSHDGTLVAFTSSSTTLVVGDTNAKEDIFVRDTGAGTTTRISVATDGTQANQHSQNPSVSGTGQTIAFHSDASNLVPDDTNNQPDVFVRGPDL